MYKRQAEGEAEILKYAVSNLRPPRAPLARIEAGTPGPFEKWVKGDRLVICDAECTADLSHGGIPILKREFSVKPGLKRARPVSYTHLDVYKRQSIWRCSCANTGGSPNCPMSANTR